MGEHQNPPHPFNVAPTNVAPSVILEGEDYGSKASNEPVGKVLFTSENDVFGGHLTLPRHEIADRGAFYELTFFCISPKNLLEDFFYSLNVAVQRRRDSAVPPGTACSSKP